MEEIMEIYSTLNQLPILLVGDEWIGGSLREFFRLEQCHLTVVETAEDGLREQKRTPFQIVISDYSLPGMNGLKFLKKVKNTSSKIKTILIASYGFDDVIEEAKDSGIDEIIKKPFSIIEVENALKIVINRFLRKEHAMKFMVCYDGSESSKLALELAKERARVNQAKIVLVTSMFRGTEFECKKILNYERNLEREQQLCLDEGIPCENHLLIRGILAGEDLVKYAHENDIDEIYIGVKRHAFFEHFIFGSVAQYVVQHAQCPVITANTRLQKKYLRVA